MLQTLQIENLVLIDSIELEFSPYLNIFTGETGTGKSILLNAIKLALGERAGTDIIRTGSEQAEIRALFIISDDKVIKSSLENCGIDAEEEIIIQRILSRSGKNRCYINGKLITQTILQEVTKGLAEITSQHAFYTLTDIKNHRFWLDLFGGLNNLREDITNHYNEIKEIKEQIEQLEDKTKKKQERLDYLKYIIDKFSSLQLTENEEEELRKKRDKLKNIALLTDSVRNAEQLVVNGDNSVIEKLATAKKEIEKSVRFDPELENILKTISESLLVLEDISHEFTSYINKLEIDPDQIDFIEDRLNKIERIKTQLNMSPDEDLMEKYKNLVNEMNELEDIEGEGSKLFSLFENNKQLILDKANQLSSKRREKAVKLGKLITKELKELGMGEAEIKVNISKGERGDITVNEAKISSSGIDEVEFLISTNPGEAPQSLRKIASGGELSRTALALKHVLSGMGPKGTYIFDEIDAGISGKIAHLVAKKLKEVSQDHQIICVTHLPQVAARGDSHFKVDKVYQDQRTKTEVINLNSSERENEIARLLGGDEDKPDFIRAAKQLLKNE